LHPLYNEIGLSLKDAERLSVLTLSHVTREYPNKLDHVIAAAADLRSPRDLHPLFFGSFDWHSCVHAYWTLATLLRLTPAMSTAPRVRSLFDQSFTREKVESELHYARRPESRTFERPYGWCWCLMLAAELKRHRESRWFEALEPLAAHFADRWRNFLPLALYPIRAGTHSNTAFALRLSLEYARSVGDGPLEALFCLKTGEWYAADRAAQAWEPSLEDFLSPTLVEAELMRIVHGRDAFIEWLAAFLPELSTLRPAALFAPVRPPDSSDGKLAHLDGLNLSRAWCWWGMATTLGTTHPLTPIARRAALAHFEASRPRIGDDYMGEHWLGSFVLLALLASAPSDD
jgi:hypothetical protein